MFKYIKEKILGKTNNIDKNGPVNLDLTSLNIERAFTELDRELMAPPDAWHYQIIDKLHGEQCKKVDLSIVKETIKNPDLSDLKSEEIIFLKYIDGRSFDNSEFPKYWTYQYRLPLQNTITKLHTSGYIILGDIKASLNNLTVKELQQVLRSNSLKVSGRKSELINRLVETLDKKNLKDIPSSEVIGLSDKGKEMLNKNKYLFLDVGLSLQELEAAHSKGVKDFHQYAIKKYKEQRKKYLNTFNKGGSRNNLYTISNIYKDKKDIENQLEYLVKVFTEDIFEDYFIRMKLADLPKNLEELMRESNNTLMIAPGIVNPIKEISQKLDIKEYELEQKIYNHTLTLPIDLTDNQFKERIRLIENHKDNLYGSIKII